MEWDDTSGRKQSTESVWRQDDGGQWWKLIDDQWVPHSPPPKRRTAPKVSNRQVAIWTAVLALVLVAIIVYLVVA